LSRKRSSIEFKYIRGEAGATIKRALVRSVSFHNKELVHSKIIIEEECYIILEGKKIFLI